MKKKMKCEDIDGLLTGYILGDITAEEREAVEAHLKECRGCEASLKEFESTLAYVRKAPRGDS